MDNYFIIHGSFSNPYANWFPWLASEIEKTKEKGKEEAICYVPQMPTGLGFQNYENWQAVLKAYVKANLINENTIVFAHSIAPAFVCKFLIENKIKLKRLVFVCGFNNYFGVSKEYDEVNRTMFCDNIEEIKNYCSEIICIYSNNDPYVKYEAEKDFADKTATKQIVIENGGHLNKETGYDKFELLKEFI